MCIIVNQYPFPGEYKILLKCHKMWNITTYESSLKAKNHQMSSRKILNAAKLKMAKCSQMWIGPKCEKLWDVTKWEMPQDIKVLKISKATKKDVSQIMKCHMNLITKQITKNMKIHKR